MTQWKKNMINIPVLKSFVVDGERFLPGVCLSYKLVIKILWALGICFSL